jgi:hypothetical protein
MYVIPLILILLVALGILFGPLAAVVVLVLFLIGLGLYKFFGPGTEPEHKPTGEVAAVGERQGSSRDDIEGGVWGEKRPEHEEASRPGS